MGGGNVSFHVKRRVSKVGLIPWGHLHVIFILHLGGNGMLKQVKIMQAADWSCTTEWFSEVCNNSNACVDFHTG